MSTHTRHNEKGQILILLSLGIVALLGFTALAIDGGAVFFDRRSAQNAADAAALAGVQALAKDPYPLQLTDKTDARYVALSSAVHTAAQNRAHDNAYGNQDGKTVVVTYPLTDFTGIHQVDGDNDLQHYVKVTITSTVKTSMIHLVFPGTVKNTVEAVAHIIPPDPGPAFSGAGMVALAPYKDGAITANGNAVISVAGGGVFVNSELSSSITATSGSLNFYTPTSATVGSYDSTKVNMDVVPGPELKNATDKYIPYPPNLSFPDPVATYCNSAGPSQKTTEDIGGITYSVYSPGTMSNLPNDNYVKLKTGIFCISVANGVGSTIGDKQTFINDPGGVLLVFTGPNDPCRVKINAGAHVDLNSQISEPYKGLIMYVDPKGYSLAYNDPKTTGGGPLQLNGGENILMKGTFYAPTCSIKMNGDGGNSYRGQIVGFNFDIAGGALVKLIYISSENIDDKPQSKVDLNQ